MPVWWGKKFSKSKQKQRINNNITGSDNESEDKNGTILSSLCNPLTTSSSSSRDLSSSIIHRSGSGFSGFDSDGGGGDRTPFPLPRPFLSPSPANCSDHTARLGSGSVSVSSSSSSGSFEDSHFALYRGNIEGRPSTRCKSPCLGSRGPSSGVSSLHPRVCGSSLGSLSERGEDGRSHGHPLPLPPGSPTSPSTMTNIRTCGVGEYLNNNTLSRWKKGRLLGRGTFGHVYLGFNSESGHMCAIKEVKLVSDDQSSKECLKQLNQEILLLSQLSHPNIVRYYGSDLGEDALSVYLEYVSGGSINKLLHEYGPFKEPVIQNYTRQILCGLAYLHGRNTVHRDIKGANILVDPNGEIKLADFGMAKHITSTSSVLSFKGSPYWMAPEVVMNSNGYNLAVDIWSLGCTILEMVTSKPPWSHYEGVAAIFKIGNSKDIPEIPDHLSAEGKNFLQLCLQRDPEARPSALQLLDHSFVRDSSINRSSITNICRDAPLSTFDGSSCTPSSCDVLSDRIFLPPTEQDSTRYPNGFFGNLGETNRIMSLPVSPCSSPLRNYAPVYRSCYLSPPRSTFSTPVYHSHMLSPVTKDANHLFGQWRDTSRLYSRTPDRNV